jgi:hypothetical protein
MGIDHATALIAATSETCRRITVATKKAAKKSSTRKYSPSASKSVETEMHEMHEGKLRSGSGKKVTTKKQAIAIGLSKARKAGAKVPEKKS